jgi:hypothetical protein
MTRSASGVLSGHARRRRLHQDQHRQDRPAATLPVTLVMLEAIRDWRELTGTQIGIKPAGGIRTTKDAMKYLVMVNEIAGPEDWLTPDLFRFGEPRATARRDQSLDYLLPGLTLSETRHQAPTPVPQLLDDRLRTRSPSPASTTPPPRSPRRGAIADSYGLFINGEFVPASGAPFPTHQPRPPKRCSPRSGRRPPPMWTARSPPRARHTRACGGA